jgi:DNA primase large subunit
LVAQRKVFLQDGFAYVPITDLVSLLVGEFRTRLSKSLIMTAKILPRLEDDERLMPIITSIGDQSVGTEYMPRGPTDDLVTADTLEEVM